MSAHSYIYVTIFYFLNYLFFKKKKIKNFLKMMLTYHISHEKIFSTALYVHGRSGVKVSTFGAQNYFFRKKSTSSSKMGFSIEYTCHTIINIKHE